MNPLLKKSIILSVLPQIIFNLSSNYAQETENPPVVPPPNFKKSNEADPQPVTFQKNTLFFTRKKEGNGFLVVFARRDSFVKLVDWEMKRLEAYFWVKQGTIYTHKFIPDSRYMLYFAQDVYESPEGELLATWFGKTAEPFFPR